MKELTVTKKEFYTALRAMLTHHTYYMDMDPKKATGRTLKSYDDFYDWLQGKI